MSGAELGLAPAKGNSLAGSVGDYPSNELFPSNALYPGHIRALGLLAGTFAPAVGKSSASARIESVPMPEFAGYCSPKPAAGTSTRAEIG